MVRRAIKRPVEVGFVTFDDLQKMYSERHSKSTWRDEKENYDVYYTAKELGISESHQEIRRLNGKFIIETLEGDFTMDNSFHLMVGVDEEIYACKVDIFNKTYDILNNK